MVILERYLEKELLMKACPVKVGDQVVDIRVDPKASRAFSASENNSTKTSMQHSFRCLSSVGADLGRGCRLLRQLGGGADTSTGAPDS
jgi:hypothetical protein